MAKDKLTFSDLINQYIDDNKINASALSNILKEKGVVISARTLQRYRAGTIIPHYDNARKILNAIGSSGYDEQEILELLKRSREEKRLNALDDVLKLDRRCVIPENSFDLGDKLPSGSVIDLIDERIEELYGFRKGAFSLYMKDLIEKDLKEYILSKEGNDNEG